MIELPLFPLHTVLFPAGPLELSVSNPHYLPLIADCIHNSEPFGAVLIQSGDPTNSLNAVPCTIGCTARIFVFELEEPATLKILALGIERFRILGLRHDHPYLIGRVEMYPFQNSNTEALLKADEALRPLVVQYLSRLAEIHNIPFNANQLPATPLALGCLSAYLLQLPLKQKQALLALDEALELIWTTEGLYERQLALLNAQIEHPEPKPEGPFSAN